MHEPQRLPLKKSQREKINCFDDYAFYLKESNFEIGINKDRVSFHKP